MKLPMEKGRLSLLKFKNSLQRRLLLPVFILFFLPVLILFFPILHDDPNGLDKEIVSWVRLVTT